MKPAKSQEAPVVRLDLAPDQRQYDPADEELRDAAYLLQKALNAEQVQVANFAKLNFLSTEQTMH